MEYAEKEIALLALETAKEFDGKIGIGKMALLLKGSESRLVKGIEARFKSGIFWHPTDAVENFVKQLVEKGLLEIRNVGYFPNIRPVVFITEEGKKALDEKREVILEIIRKDKEVKLNEPMQMTLDGISKGQTIEAIAKERGLAVSTIWKHLIDLCALGLLKPEAVMPADKIEKIRGVAKGKSKVGEIKLLLPAASYDEIRLVMAQRGREEPQVL